MKRMNNLHKLFYKKRHAEACLYKYFTKYFYKTIFDVYISPSTIAFTI